MKLTQRRATLFVLILQTFGSALIFVSYLLSNADAAYTISAGAGMAIFGVLLIVYWRGWEPARYIVIVAMTALVALGTPEPYVSQEIAYSTLLPAVVALILAEPIWVVGSAALIMLTLLVRSGGQGIYADPINLVVAVMFVGGMILARFVTDTALDNARESARQAREEKARAEQQAEELVRANELMNTQLEQQKELLDLVMTLETPVVPLADGVLLAPIVGHIDARRAEVLTERMLQEASAQRARLVVLDIAGVSIVDTAVARALIHAVQALRLLGCDVALSGISATVAVSLIHLGVDLDNVQTVRSPQEALANYFGHAAQQATPGTTLATTKRSNMPAINPNDRTNHN
jgi:rsbT co-antagonist protein RsbR